MRCLQLAVSGWAAAFHGPEGRVAANTARPTSVSECRVVDMKYRLFTLVAILGLMIHSATFAQERSIVVASTTSTERAGLFGFIKARFSTGPVSRRK
jgi:hypothetical protein